MVCIGFQDTTAIPLIFASVLGTSTLTDSDKNFKTNAISYVLIYTVFVTVYKWTIAYGMMKPSLPIGKDSVMSEEGVFHQAPLYDNEEVPIVPIRAGWFWTLKKIMNPPIYATLISIPLGLIPYLKEYVFSGSGAVLTDNVFAALVSMGSTVSPLICILLGSNLSQGYPPSADIPR